MFPAWEVYTLTRMTVAIALEASCTVLISWPVTYASFKMCQTTLYKATHLCSWLQDVQCNVFNSSTVFLSSQLHGRETENQKEKVKTYKGNTIVP